ncbi:hypothetical protein EJ02DRAFT_444114 [Clathrospora elynae]|uniref:ceramidase n=1 Tax=Clathrospora elynae TaxID=706981 RepID=A0A6A5SNY1_9PLEO|nr:hypothetical protein EJ02DRAFT_444114 [Clathrospora elynae]
MADLPVPAKGKPPVYTIDLSLPPRERYTDVATDYLPILNYMFLLFDEVVSSLKLPAFFFHFVGRVLLRRLHSSEQTEELKGISKATGLPMYLLVAYNVALDLLMGCTSGGIMSMPLLRQAIVQLEFIERPGGDVIASTVGYVGFVGVLTGVRQDLSVSLNFRPYHDATGLSRANAQYYWNTLMVLLGRRLSISALMRDCLLPRALSHSRWRLFHSSRHASTEPASRPPYTSADISTLLFLNADMQEVVDESIARKACVTKDWLAFTKKQKRRARQGEEPAVGVQLEKLKEWNEEYPVCNPMTHFACVMDPREGVFRWFKCFEDEETEVQGMV